MTVKGIDISHWQNPTPSLVGLGFVAVKAIQGGTKDPAWDAHKGNVLRAGLVLIAYDFGVDDMSGAEQARRFLAVVGDSTKVVALDMEGAHETHEAQAREWFATCKAAGKKTLLYHSESGFHRDLGQDGNWVAHWGTTPPEIPWVFWQYRGDPLDLDLFHGDLAGLKKFAGIVAAKPKPVTKAWHIVHRGETLSAIAHDHHTTLKAILAFPENREYRKNPSLIHAGDRIRVK